MLETGDSNSWNMLLPGRPTMAAAIGVCARIIALQQMPLLRGTDCA